MGRQQRRQLADARLVGPDAAADRQGLRVDPDAVAALHRARILDAAEDRDAHACIGQFVKGRFRPPQRLAHGEDDRAMVGHQRGVVREDGIGKPVIRVRQPFDLRARGSDQIGERLVLPGCPNRIEAGAIVPFGSIRVAHGAPCLAHQHAPERPSHRLRTVSPLRLDVHS